MPRNTFQLKIVNGRAESRRVEKQRMNGSERKRKGRMNVRRKNEGRARSHFEAKTEKKGTEDSKRGMKEQVWVDEEETKQGIEIDKVKDANRTRNDTYVFSSK
ncbi:hypothetical protein BT96DRAFT_275772 [Gymnopus androsaceus JB14]|uniref:Uncharacterized protein n=1 Tax=Gymnopus androsaceus JB14 TaxID=1447944 RepID=A0A6A4H3Y6_9AGAR|nr:hypothetical protein BT96DRAFT_275772 [Gymnopus androsaceus JB14]